MARYDDYDYDDDEQERPRSRRGEQSLSRRGSMMRQRLRRARGEDAGEDVYDDDEDSYPEEYMRARGIYIPATARGNGCMATLLYALLGVLAIGMLALLIGNRFLSNLNASVPAQIRQIVATPTPTIRDRGGTIQQIRSLSRLETQSFSVERIVEASVERGNVLDLVLGDRLLLIASGTVVAGVDLSKLRDSDVQMSQDGKQIVLRLPPSEVFSKALDTERTRVYDRSTGFLAPENKDLETQARQEAEQEILQAACEGNIMQKAADEAERAMERFLGLLDFDSVEVIATTGQCVAGPTTPTLPTPAP